LSEVLPIRTTDRITYELRPVGDGHDWFAVAKPGERLAAIISPISYIDMRQARGIEDATARIDRAIELARVEVFFRGAPIGGPERIPELHVYSLAARVFALSSVGSDPFGEAPVGSQP
jgi:hypothetical protein